MSSTADLKDKRIGVLLGSVHDTLATKNYPTAKILQYENSTDLVLAVLAGKVDAGLSDAHPLAEQMRVHPELGVLGEPLISYPIGAGFRKGNAQLRDAFDKFLAETKANGMHAEMSDRWFAKHDSAMPDVPVPNPRGKLVVGIAGNGLPMAAMRDGVYVGFDIELVRRFAASQGRTVEFSQMPFGSLIAACATGKVDMVVANMFITEERKQRIDFSEPYYASGVLVYALTTNIANPAQATSAPQGSGGLLTSVEDLKDKRIAVQLGTVFDIYATKTFPQASVQQYPTFQEVTLAVSAGKVDAGFADVDTLKEVMQANPELTPFGKPIFSSPVAAGFRKNSADLRASFNTFLERIRQDGTWADMADRWMTKRSQAMPDLPKVKTNGTLVVGISSGGFPFAAVQNNDLAGFDVELARRFGASIGKEIRFADQEFAGLIAALVSGKIDVIIADMYDTQERRKQIDFSDAYFEQDNVAFTLKSRTAAAGASAVAASPSPSGALTSVDDLKDKRIAVQLGTVYDLYATKTFPNATVLQYPTFQEVTLSVSTGKAEAGLSDIDVLNEVMRANPNLVTLGKPIFKSPVAAGFRKTDPDKRAAFNAFLKEIRQNGVWADMVDRWMTKRDQRMPELPKAATRGTVVVGTSSGGFPFAAVQNNELAGFDIELAKRYGAYVGAEIRFVDQDFAAHIAALVSGKIDVILASMFDTEERRKRIDFSEPYFEQDSYAFTLKAKTVAAAANAGAGTAPPSPSFVERVQSSFRSNIMLERRYLLILDGLKTTAVIAVLATLFGTALGALVCYMRMSPLAVLHIPARIYISVLRGIPVLVLLMLIFYVVFASVNISPVLVAVVAFGMNFAAYVSEMFRSGIESIDKGQSEAGIAMGFTRTQTFGFVILPQMIQRILPVYKGEFISMVKMTSIVGYIAVQDLTKASDIIRSRTFDPFFPLIMVAVLYFVIAWVLMQALEYVERVTDPKHRRPTAVAR